MRLARQLLSALRRSGAGGRLCIQHLQRVQAMVGTQDCAWPGCTRRAWDRTGACSFHRQVCWGLIGE